jgi:ectoine hydroxylase-related dioxygenase (phytanoyl-CoA dioxygenase family)
VYAKLTLATKRLSGATRFIPGSHLWDYREGPPKEEQTVHAELNPGDAFMMLSGCFHGGSANTTTDEDRVLLSTFNTRGWMRQEENQYLANSMESIKELPSALQERMGYGLSRPFMGWVDLKSPMLLLHPEESKHQKDLWGS